MYQLVAALLFLVSLVFVSNPMDLFMPTMVQYGAAVGVFVVATIFLGLVLTDTGRDEREVQLRAEAARWGYMVGILVLVIAVVWSLCTGMHPDLWILLSLGVMVLVRVVHRVM